MATGPVANDLLAVRSPATVKAIVALMAMHPDRARFEATLRDLTGTARDRLLFDLIARWRDGVGKSPITTPTGMMTCVWWSVGANVWTAVG